MLWLIWLVLRFFKIVPKVCRQASWIGRKANRTKFSETAASRSSKIIEFFDKQDFILKAILVEFQETQCFFMVACVAVVLFSKRHHNIFGASNMVNVWADHSIAGMCAAAGSFPVVWSLWTLQRSNMVSGWILFLSTATLAVAQFALYSMGKMPELNEMGHLDGTFPASCGRHPPPMRYCGWDGLDSAMMPNDLIIGWVNPVVLTVYVITVGMYLWPFAEKLLKSRAVAGTRPGLAQHFSRISITWHTEWFYIVRGVITALIELLLLATFLVYIFSLCYAALGVTAYNMEIIDWTAWGFGQFVALTTWAAVLCKYLYWTIFGTEAYAKSRFGEGNHIVQEDHPGSHDRNFEEKSGGVPGQSTYHSLGDSQNDMEMGRLSGARLYQNQRDSEARHGTYDFADTHVDSAPVQRETEFLRTSNFPTPRLSIHLPPGNGIHQEQDDLHGGPEPERLDSEANLIQKAK
ncbi:hypothetical protein N7492_003187 [Penicillium capsulatum]|uniref:Integral membrane protein n=1 Tax=Penicillium capsulatum TaxID=69766 RepID=A0A9W9LX52_9EURO|nr:hypothetical protein N7492_003187 [Penicillium capsulatum]